jgi:hypothetical protein
VEGWVTDLGVMVSDRYWFPLSCLSVDVAAFENVMDQQPPSLDWPATPAHKMPTKRHRPLFVRKNNRIEKEQEPLICCLLRIKNIIRILQDEVS